MAKDETNRGGRRVRAGDKQDLADEIAAGRAARILEAPSYFFHSITFGVIALCIFMISLQKYTLDEARKNDRYASYIFLGDGGKMYEYAKIYDKEKIKIVVTKGPSNEEVDRINILPLLSPISPLPEGKVALFNITVQ